MAEQPSQLNNPETNSDSSLKKRRKIGPQTTIQDPVDLGQSRWRTETEQQIYSSKLVDALHLIRRPESASATGRAVRDAADRVLAVSAKSRTRWSRAILTGRLSLRLSCLINKKHKKAAKAGSNDTRLRKPMVQKKLPPVQRKVKVLSRLVPGCRKMPRQNKKMRNISESSDVAVGRDRRVADCGLTTSAQRVHASSVRDPISLIVEPTSHVREDSTYSLGFMPPPRRPGIGNSLMGMEAAGTREAARSRNEHVRADVDEYFSADDDGDDAMDDVGPSSRFQYGMYSSSHVGSSHAQAEFSADEESDDDGGLEITDLIPSYTTHVAHFIWRGEDRGIVLCHSRYRSIHEWELHRRDALSLVEMTGLSHLRDCMYDYLDEPLLTAFIERWHPETNSFHFGFGEMTITLHDVWYLLQIPVEGRAVIPECDGDYDRISNALSIALHLTPTQVQDPNILGWKRGKLDFNLMRSYLDREEVDAGTLAMGYLLRLVGGSLFADKSKTHFHASVVQCLYNIRGVSQYAWGAATLANLYRELGLASDHKCRQVSGFLTLFQAWIYAYFPYFRPKSNPNWRPSEPYARRWIPTKVREDEIKALNQHRQYLDCISAVDVSWTPFVVDPACTVPISLFMGIIHCRTINEPYMSDRVVRQFGYRQIIPYRPIRPVVKAPGKSVYQHPPTMFFEDHWRIHSLSLTNFKRCNVPGQCTDEYLSWFLPRTYPHIMRNVVVDEFHVAPRPTVDYEETYYQCASLAEPFHEDNLIGEPDYGDLRAAMRRLSIVLQDGMPSISRRSSSLRADGSARVWRGSGSGSGRVWRGRARGRGGD